ncbi:hypothetical protein PR003_g28331 [Phytophthora rubi]|uniref:C2 domain-containing protein n=1 Tax=Phytophthora rubi TaxID=129364 RepID=A0A6A4BR71_9STRA|nr:hypothetical protein PR003_g28331 [Phytophthora rubi]
MPLQQLVVGIAGGRDLLVGDLNSSSDPFVQLTTLEPEWNETFKLGSRGFDLRAATSLRFLVLDFDGLKRDDVLGVLEVPLDLVACPMDDWYRIVKVPELMSCDAKGELHLAISQPAKSVAFQGEGEDASSNLLYVTIDSGKDLLPMDRNNSSSHIDSNRFQRQLVTVLVAWLLKVRGSNVGRCNEKTWYILRKLY